MRAPLGLWFTDALSVFRSLTPTCKKSPPSHTHCRGWNARADRKVTLALVADEAARDGDDRLRARVRSHYPRFDHNNYLEEEMNVRNIRLGIYGGLAGGVVFGAMMGMMGTLPMIGKMAGHPSAFYGFLVHMVNSAIIGAGFGVLLGRGIGRLDRGAHRNQHR